MEAPKKAAKKKSKFKATIEDASDNKDDVNYNPPKCHHPEPASPGHIYDSDGNEMVEETEHGENLVSQLIK